ISICSLHATKLYHSIEGGLVISNHPELNQKLRYIRNFGISGFDKFAELGINGKNSEFHAAMGLVNLNHIERIHEKRKALSESYDENLKDFPHQKPLWHGEATKNYAYYPILLESEVVLLKVKEKLEDHQIQTRRYFYPSLAMALPYLDPKEMEVTDSVSKRVLCLPFYFDLNLKEIEKICNLICS